MARHVFVHFAYGVALCYTNDERVELSLQLRTRYEITKQGT